MKRWGAAVGLLGAGVFLLGGCGDKKSAAASELKEAGYPMTVEGLFAAAAADDVEALKGFAKGGLDLKSTNAEGGTALHQAAAAGRDKAALYLLDQGIPVDVLDSKGRTPLLAAIGNDQGPMVRLLMRQGANPKRKDSEGYTPLMRAVQQNKPHAIAELAPKSREELDSALLVGSLLGQTEAVDVLTQYGASVFARMDDGRTALMVAAQNGHAQTVEMLLEAGANRLATDDHGQNAAQLAQEAGHGEIADLLNRPPDAKDLVLKDEKTLALEMEQLVDLAADEGRVPGDSKEAGAHAASMGFRRLETSGGDTVVRKISALAGETLPNAKADSVVHESEDSGTAPLVMRYFRHRELPISVETVRKDRAVLRLAGSKKPVELAVGETVPGSSLRVTAIHRKFISSKENNGVPGEVSVVTVQDPATGVSRELIHGVPASAHDPMAVVEDADGGRFYARVGDEFQTREGIRYRVEDIRPNQLVMENLSSRRAITLPLRGPRG